MNTRANITLCPYLMRLKTDPEREAKQQSITSRLPSQSCKRPNAGHLRRQRMADMRAAGPPGPVFFPPFSQLQTNPERKPSHEQNPGCRV